MKKPTRDQWFWIGVVLFFGLQCFNERFFNFCSTWYSLNISGVHHTPEGYLEPN